LIRWGGSKASRLLLCARFIETRQEGSLSAFYLSADIGVSCPEDCFDRAFGSSDPAEKVRWLVASRMWDDAALAGIEILQGIMRAEGGFKVEDLRSVVTALHSVRARCISEGFIRDRLLALCMYIGALFAISSGYSPHVVQGLVLCASALSTGRATLEAFPMSRESMILQSVYYFRQAGLAPAGRALMERTSLNEPSSVKAILEKGLKVHVIDQESGKEYDVLNPRGRADAAIAAPSGNGKLRPTGAMRAQGPHVDGHLEYLLFPPFAGPSVSLEDGVHVMSLQHATEWALVCPFSPLCTGEWINPF